MKKYITLIFLLPAFSFSIVAQPLSTFTFSDDGWTALPDGLGSAPSASWTASNGDPGGCLKVTDNSLGIWYYNSPAAFNGDMSSYYNGNLNFDLKQNTSSSQTSYPDIIIVKSDGSQIVYNTTVNPGTSWTFYSVPLNETGWKYTSLAGSAVTGADMIAYLSDIAEIKIRGDYSSISTETDWLDNVSISVTVVLPIELSSFTGQEDNPGIAHLTWETLSEINAAYFQVEKSMNGGSSFDSIGFISAHGTTSLSNIYNFYDDGFSSDAYYRLKEEDDDNSASYSGIIFIKSGNNIPPELFPNPSSDIITVKNIDLSYTTVRICDSYSREITSVNEDYNASGQFSIDISGLADGTYFLTFVKDEKIITCPFAVLH